MLKTRLANGTFGFFRQDFQPFKKPKKPFLANARTDRGTIIQTLFILKNEIRKKLNLLYQPDFLFKSTK